MYQTTNKYSQMNELQNLKCHKPEYTNISSDCISAIKLNTFVALQDCALFVGEGNTNLVPT